VTTHNWSVLHHLEGTCLLSVQKRRSVPSNWLVVFHDCATIDNNRLDLITIVKPHQFPFEIPGRHHFWRGSVQHQKVCAQAWTQFASDLTKA
jgi:hypothetical protein